MFKFVDGEQIDLTQEEEDEFLSMQSAMQAKDLQDANKNASQEALNKSDLVVLRAYENSKTVPEEWVSYRAALRQSLRNGTIPPTSPTTYP